MKPKKVKKVKNQSIYIEKCISKNIAYFIYKYHHKYSCKIIKISKINDNLYYIYIFGMISNLWKLNELCKKKSYKNVWHEYTKDYLSF